jgi:cyclohexa-1,5-dienecarbonyl-CoA hydratase
MTVRLEPFAGEERAAALVVDRPPLNVLDLATLADLDRVLAEVAAAPPQVLVVRGGGERAFSAGVAVEDHTPDLVATMLGRFHGALARLRALPSIAVAAVRGHCLGGGMELAAACDLVVAEEGARFGQPEIKLGCYPPYAAALYPARLGLQRTFDLLLTGRTLDAAEAAAAGFVARLAPAGGLDAAVAGLVGELTAASAAVTPLVKRAVRAGEEGGFARALAESERIYLEELAATEDMQEGLEAFLAKRPPAWKHR